MSQSVGLYPAITTSAPLAASPYAQTQPTDIAPTDSAQPSDSVTLSLRARALQKMLEDQPSIKIPGSDATVEEKSNFESLFNDYELAQTKVDNTQLSASFQSYADIINDPKATDEQKLQAYSKYRAESVLADTSFGSYQSSDQDFKLDWLTRDSDFMKRVNSGDISLYYQQQATLKANSKSGGMDFDQDTANLIDVGAGMTRAQQGVIAINIVSTNLMTAIMNGNKSSLLNDPAAANKNMTPGFEYTGAKSVDTDTALATALSITLHDLNMSRTGSSSDANSVAYKTFFVQMTNLFAQNVRSLIQA